jgi:hypothetical protein
MATSSAAGIIVSEMDTSYAAMGSCQDEHSFQSRADENAASRVWAGIHFRSAAETGVQLGREVGDAVIEWAEADGSD